MASVSVERLQELIEEHAHREGALLPLLHAIQSEWSYIPAEVVPPITRALKISRAEIQGVISFYHDFREQAPAGHRIAICRAESCQAVGARELEQQLTSRLGVGPGATTSDGRITVDPIYCFGNCACSPAVRINDQLHGRVTSERLDELLDSLV